MSLIKLLRIGTTARATQRFVATTATLRAAEPSSFNKGGAESASGVLHTTDSYAKDVDESPVVDQKVHRVDSFSENVQKPYEPPSGEFSQTGASSASYATMNKGDQPYAPKEEGEKQRYGATKNWVDDKGRETSKPGEGPAGSDAGGRKPERS